MSRALGDVLFADNLQGLIKELGQADKLDEWGKRVGVEGATDGEGTGVVGCKSNWRERERERKARVKERKSQTFPNGLEMWKCSGRSDVVLVDSKVRRDLMS